MKKVLHVTMSNAYGGAETVIFSIINNLSDRYDFCYTCPSGQIENILKLNNIKYRIMNNGSLRELKKIVNEYKPDIIHAHDFRASVLASIFGKKIKVISHLHTSHHWIRTINIKSFGYILATLNFNKIIVVSQALSKEIIFKKYINQKTVVIKNPVDKSKIKQLSMEYKENSEYDIAFLGRLSDYKNPIKFINIISKLKEKKEEIRAVIIGDGELRGECSEIINSLDLSNNITMKGFKLNPFPILMNSKVLIMPSKVEALGLSAAEAMVLGKPVIASNAGGLKEVVNDKCGFLCNSDSDYINAAYCMLNNMKLYEELSKGAIKTSENFIDSNKYSMILGEMYKTL